MESNATEDTIHETRLIEADEAAVSATVRRLELCTSVIFVIGLIVAFWAFCIYVPLSNSPMFHYLLACLIGIWLVLLGILHFVAPICLKKMDIVLGKDFIAGSEVGGLDSLFMRLIGQKTVIRYDAITRVVLDVSNGQITGATVVGKNLVLISVRRVMEPHIVIRAIREHTGSEVQWRTSPLRSKKLSGDEVDSLIAETENRRNSNALLQQEVLSNG